MRKPYTTGPETARLEHRAYTIDDAPEFFALNSNPEVMRLTGEPLLPSLDAAKEAIVQYPDFDEVGYGRWACVLKQTREIIGFCGLKYLPEMDAVDLGYRFLPEYWGHGFATEACEACLVFGFDTLRLRESFGFVLPENVASIRVLEKVGMQPDGEVIYDGLLALRYIKRAPGICEPSDDRAQ